MKQLVCTEPGSMKIRETEIPAGPSAGTRVRIERVGICGTDFHAFRGRQPYFKYPRVLGHELSARLESNTGNLKKGQRVAIIPYLHCGKCSSCRKGLTNCCQELKVLGVHTDGGMQEFLTVPEEFLLPVGDLPADHTALIEPLSIGFHAVRRAGLREGESALVVGCGPIGLATAFFALRAGADVRVSDVSPKKLGLAAGMLPEAQIIPSSGVTNEPEKESRDLVDVAFDATGNVKVMELLPSGIAHGGRIVLVGLTREEIGFSHPFIHARETSIYCSRNATRSDFEEVLSCLQNGDFPVDKYITGQSLWSDIPDILEDRSDSRESTIKIMTKWS